MFREDCEQICAPTDAGRLWMRMWKHLQMAIGHRPAGGSAPISARDHEGEGGAARFREEVAVSRQIASDSGEDVKRESNREM
jgi:hypothetical protein